MANFVGRDDIQHIILQSTMDASKLMRIDDIATTLIVDVELGVQTMKMQEESLRFRITTAQQRAILKLIGEFHQNDNPNYSTTVDNIIDGRRHFSDGQHHE